MDDRYVHNDDKSSNSSNTRIFTRRGERLKRPLSESSIIASLQVDFSAINTVA